MVASPQTQIAESTQDLILSLFPPGDPSNFSLKQLANKVEALTSATTLSTRLDAFVDLYAWTRQKDAAICDPLSTAPTVAAEAVDSSSKRSLVWTSILETSREVLTRYRASIGLILRETD